MARQNYSKKTLPKAMYSMIHSLTIQLTTIPHTSLMRMRQIAWGNVEGGTIHKEPNGMYTLQFKTSFEEEGLLPSSELLSYRLMDRRQTRIQGPLRELHLIDEQPKNSLLQNEWWMLGTSPKTQLPTSCPNWPTTQYEDYQIHMQVFHPFHPKIWKTSIQCLKILWQYSFKKPYSDTCASMGESQLGATFSLGKEKKRATSLQNHTGRDHSKHNRQAGPCDGRYPLGV